MRVRVRISAVLVAGVLCVLCPGITAIGAAEGGAKRAAAAAPKAAAPSPRVRLWGEWAKMKTLTAEQKAQILRIHAQFLADRKAMEQKQQEQIVALLGEAQKAELRQIIEREAVEKKLRTAQRKAEQAEASVVEPPAPVKPAAQPQPKPKRVATPKPASRPMTDRK